MEETKNKIEEQDNDNIYVYSEYPDNDNPSGYADKHNLDDSGPNYSQVGNNDVDLSEDHYRESSDSFGSSPFFLMLKVLFSPIEGWKSVRRSKPGIEEMQQKCFYPLLGIYSLSKFMRIVYNTRTPVAEVIVSAISSFVSFFFGYFCIMLIMKALMHNELEKYRNEDFSKIFVCISLSTLCLFFTLLDIFPMLWAVLIFLPIWTIYAICWGVRFFKFPENKKAAFTVILSGLIVGVPCLIDWFLQAILPN